MSSSTQGAAAVTSGAATTAVPHEWTSTWNLFDERHTGAVSHTDLKHILRSLGRRYTEAEFSDLLRPLPNPAPFDAFVKLMQQPYTGPTEDDLVTALRAFDVGDSGSLRLSELITLLTTLGEKMPETDVRQLLAEVPTDEKGRVRIDELAAYLCTPVPTTTPDIVELQRQLNQVSATSTAAGATTAAAAPAAAAATTGSP
jgi:Ca2+-binding EF-hand superfamily protein